MQPKRKSNRLQNYNYSLPGYYFITICTQDRVCCFGDIKNGEMILNESGKIVNDCWFDLPNHYANCQLDAFQIMPNHVHGILTITHPVGNGLKPFPTKQHGLSEIIRALKTFSARKINAKFNGNFSWQTSFYDHVIRKDESLNKIREYIHNNPKQWELDSENPKNLK